MDKLTEAEAKAEQFISDVNALREPITAGQARLTELKSRRAEIETYTRVESMTLAERCYDHDKQIQLTEHAIKIDQGRLKAELGKAEEIELLLKEQTTDFRSDPDNTAGYSYEARYTDEIENLNRESNRPTMPSARGLQL